MLMNFSWLEGGKVAGSAQPGLRSEVEEDLRFIRAVGLKAIISLTEKPLPPEALNALDFSYLHLPVEDFTPPSLAQIREGLAFIKAQNSEAHPVLVHCGAGMGRTGTLLACYLVSQGKLPQEALDEVRQLRPGSVETVEQEQLVFQLAQGGA